MVLSIRRVEKLLEMKKIIQDCEKNHSVCQKVILLFKKYK